jgi:hypothetical protein
MAWAVLFLGLTALPVVASETPPASPAVPKLDLRPNVGPEEIPPGWTWRGIGGLILLAGSVALAVWLLWSVRPRPRRSVRLPPEAIALTELDRLHRSLQTAPDPAAVERICTTLTFVVRRYVEQRFNFPALEQTTPEFLAGLAEQNVMPESGKEFLARFLNRADLVKFAHASMPRTELEEWIEQAKVFVRSAADQHSRPEARKSV